MSEQEYHDRQRKISASTRRLLGKQVRVTLDNGKDGAPTIVTGKLLGFGTDGQFEIGDEDGTVHYCWPMLSIEEAT